MTSLNRRVAYEDFWSQWKHDVFRFLKIWSLNKLKILILIKFQKLKIAGKLDVRNFDCFN